MKVDYLVVGAGFTGAVIAERIANDLGRTVLLVDRRTHVGGNAYDERNAAGLLVHHYGPHIFHTNSDKVFQYLSRFTRWRPYFHRVLAMVEGTLVPVPFNFDSIDALFTPGQARTLQDALLQHHRHGDRVPILKLRESTNEHLRFLAEYVYEHVFLHYTRKQWDLDPTDLSPSVTARVPIVLGRDGRYFQDRYQAMPADGYTALFWNLLRSPRIRLLLNTPYRDIADQVTARRVVYTGPIDEYYGYRFGRLPYRSLRFEFETLPGDRLQPVGTVNYPSNNPWTRITEMKWLTGDAQPASTLCTEYPQAHEPEVNDPFYPIPRDENKALHDRYLAHAAEQPDAPLFCGRLGDYQYYNMDQAVARALVLYERLRQEAAGHPAPAGTAHAAAQARPAP